MLFCIFAIFIMLLAHSYPPLFSTPLPPYKRKGEGAGLSDKKKSHNPAQKILRRCLYGNKKTGYGFSINIEHIKRSFLIGYKVYYLLAFFLCVLFAFSLLCSFRSRFLSSLGVWSGVSATSNLINNCIKVL